MAMRIALYLVAFAFVAGPASAAEESAEAAFEAGAYEQALELSESVQSADMLAFQARVLLAEAMSVEGAVPEAERVGRALALAEEAVRLEARHVEGRLQLAIALSLSARVMPLREARESGYADRTRDLARGVIEDDPDNIYAHAFLSVWNLEVLQRGGRLGGLVMGASVRAAERRYAAAIAIDPEDASVRWQYARALAALDAGKYREQIVEALQAADAARAETALEAVMQVRARQLLELVRTESDVEVQAAARQML